MSVHLPANCLPHLVFRHAHELWAISTWPFASPPANPLFRIRRWWVAQTAARSRLLGDIRWCTTLFQCSWFVMRREAGWDDGAVFDGKIGPALQPERAGRFQEGPSNALAEGWQWRPFCQAS